MNTFSKFTCNLVLRGQLDKGFDADRGVGRHVECSSLRWDKEGNGLLDLFCALAGAWESEIV